MRNVLLVVAALALLAGGFLAGRNLPGSRSPAPACPNAGATVPKSTEVPAGASIS